MFESNNYTVITRDEPNADDAYCYAAHMLSERVSDDLQDMLEAVDVLEDATLSVVSEIMASMLDLVPLFGDVAEIVVRVTDNLAEAAYDWVKENARDIQARALAAEIFYCGIKAAMENGGQSSLRSEIITAAGANLIEFGFSFINNEWEVPDLWDVFEDAYNALDGEAIGYGIVAWFLLTDFAMDTLGAERPIELIIARATRNAEAFDSRDCTSMACNAWCFEYDFAIGDELGWFPYPHSGDLLPLAEFTGLKWEDVPWVHPTQVPDRTFYWMRVRSPVFTNVYITTIKLFYDFTPCTNCAGGSENISVDVDLDLGRTNLAFAPSSGSNQETTITVNAIIDQINPNVVIGWAQPGLPNGSFSLHKVELCGQGYNPFA